MTDKQIIIDGVDVSGCEYFRVTLPSGCLGKYRCNCDSISTKSLNCEENNCIYKQLKRKEQGCEELRQYHNKCCEEFEKEKKEWLEKYNQVSRDFYSGKYCNAEKCQQLNQLKAENDELKEELEELKEENEYNEANAIEFKQTLTEIKEIMKKHCRKCKKHKFYYFQLCCTCKYTDILQKISECEGNDGL